MCLYKKRGKRDEKKRTNNDSDNEENTQIYIKWVYNKKTSAINLGQKQINFII